MRTFLRVLALTCLFIAMPSITPRAAQADVPEVGNCKADAELQVGATGASVICVQWNLLWMGYFKGLINGTYDQATADAVIRFQMANPPLTINGIAGAQTLIAMYNFSGVDKAPAPPCLADAPVVPGDKGPAALCVQQTLQQKGIYPGKVNGNYDSITKVAVRAFQLANAPLTASGSAGPDTLAAMGIWSGFTKPPKGAPPDTKWWPAGFQAEPNWHVVGGIPVYGTRHPCTRADADIIATEFAKDGADVSTQQYFIYIASREGNCNFKAVNINPATRDDSHCTFQINALSGTFEPNGQLGRRGWTKDNIKASMQNCADAASDLWVFCARGPWTPPTYTCSPPWAGDLGPNGDV